MPRVVRWGGDPLEAIVRDGSFSSAAIVVLRLWLGWRACLS